MNKKNISTSRIVYIVCSIVICLFMLSVCFVNSVLAKYTAKSDAQDAASVATFEVEINKTSSSENYSIPYSVMSPGTEIVIDIKINVDSEVAIKCDISASSLGILPLDITLSQTSFDLAAGTYTLNETLTIFWSENANDYKYAQEFDMVILNVSVTQKD